MTIARCGLVLFLLLVINSATAKNVEVKGLFSGSALIIVDGEQKLLKRGKSFNGVTLVTADSEKAVLEVDGERHTLGLSKRISSSYQKAEVAEVRLQPSHGGHYVTPARINNRPVSVMVDTGATTVAMSLPQAKALGIDYRNGALTPISTANGYTEGYLVNLRSVTVGTVTVNNVDALVSVGDFPKTILLGNSYLSKVKMFRENGVLVLQNQY